MNILITGAAGFVGRNLVENLKAIRDGKNRTRPNLKIDKIYEYDLNNSQEELDVFCSDCDFVFNLAGVNRPKDVAEFKAGNFGFASQLLATLKKHNNKCPVMLSSSIQATLAGRFGTSEYGLSKRDGEELFFRYAEEIGATVYVYRFPNLAGKWCKPNYNSAVATFCHNIANDLPITVNDPNVELELLFIDDLLEEMYDCIEGKPHHCDYPRQGEILEGVEYNGLTPLWTNEGRYCGCPVTHKATLGQIVELLHTFHDQPQTLIMPAIPANSLEKKLYSMYLSYLPKEKIAFDLKTNVDDRGSFTELLKTLDHGQFSVNISKPGITKGQHWHNSKWEFFIVVAGHGLIQERKIGTNEILEFEVSGEHIQAVHMLPGYVHNIINLSETENLVTLMWANEVFDSEKPETYYESVQMKEICFVCQELPKYALWYLQCRESYDLINKEEHEDKKDKKGQKEQEEQEEQEKQKGHDGQENQEERKKRKKRKKQEEQEADLITLKYYYALLDLFDDMHIFPKCPDFAHIGEACECTNHENFNFYRNVYNTYTNILKEKGLQKIKTVCDICAVLPYTIFQDLDMIAKNMYVKELTECKKLELESLITHCFLERFGRCENDEHCINQIDLVWGLKLLDQYIITRNRQKLSEEISFRNRMLTMGEILDNPPKTKTKDFRQVRPVIDLKKKLVYLDFGVYQLYESKEDFRQQLESYTESYQFIYSPAHIEEVCRMNKQGYEEKRCESILKLCNNIEALPVDDGIRVVFEPIEECLGRAKKFLNLNEAAEKNDCAKFENLDDEMCQVLKWDTETLTHNREALSSFTLLDLIADKSDIITNKDIETIFHIICLSEASIESFNDYCKQKRTFHETRLAIRQLYLLMNALGIHRNKIEGTTKFNYKALYPSYDRKFYRTIRSGFYDVEHLSYASISDYFITCDRNLSYQAKEIYKYLGLGTKVIYCDKNNYSAGLL